MSNSMYIAHYGIKGMKWGVRRSPAQLGHLTSARKTLISTKEPQIPFGSKTEWTEKKTPFGARNSIASKQKPQIPFGAKTEWTEKKVPFGARSMSQEDKSARKDRENALKNRRTVSTEELKERVARLETEKKFKELAEADLHPGRKAVNEALARIGTKVVVTAATGAALYYLKYKTSGDKKIDRQELANAIFNGGPKKK